MSKLIIVLMMMLFPLSVEAKEYEIENFYSEIKINADGSADVKELFFLDYETDGFDRDFYAENLSDYEDYYQTVSRLEIKGISVLNADEVTYDTMQRSDFTPLSYQKDNKGYDKTFNIINYSSSLRLDVTYNTTGKIAYLIEYKLQDVVLIHKDIAEFRVSVITHQFYHDIKEGLIKVILPNEDNSGKFYYNATGGSKYESVVASNQDNSSFEVKINNSDMFIPLTLRTTFDYSLIEDKTYLLKTSDNMFQQIQFEESKLNEELKLFREENERTYQMIIFINILFLVGLVLSLINTYLKYDKEITVFKKIKYYRDFTGNYDIEVVDYLINGKSTEKGLSASIINLIYKKKIEAKMLSDKNHDCQFSLINNENLSRSEEILVNLLFDEIGKNNVVTTKQIDIYIKNPITCKTFMAYYESWKTEVYEQVKKEELYEKRSKNIYNSFIFVILSFALFFYSDSLEVPMILPYISLISSILYFLYTLKIKKKTKKGLEHYQNWKAFGNFLKDFSIFEERELPEMILWEKYLVYATVYGLTDKLEKSMKIKSVDIYGQGVQFAIPALIIITQLILHGLLNSIVVGVKGKTNKF